MKKKVFICYRRETSGEFVKKLCVFLKAFYDVYCDIDHDDEPSLVSQEIKKEIIGCTHFLLIVDEKTFDFNEKDDYLLTEMQCVLGKRRKGKNVSIIPVLTPNSKWPSKNEDIVKNNKLEDLIDCKYLQITEEGSCLQMTEEDRLKLLKRINYVTPLKKRVNRISKLVIATCFMVACLLAGVLIHKYYASKSVKLVFAGGGSVANIIKNNYSVDCKTYDNSLYLDLPSQNAWSLLAEEVMINHTSDTEKNKYYPICLSALEANDSAFYKLVGSEKFKEKGTVISYKIGYDTLMVFTNFPNIDENDDVFTKELSMQIKNLTVDNNSISIDNLSQLIKAIRDYNNTFFSRKDYNNKSIVCVYCTQEGSGTYSCYENIFKQNGMTFSKDYLQETVKWYNQKSSLPAFNITSYYIILSSKHYSPETLDSTVINRGLFVEYSKDSLVRKPMYLYFAGYRKGKEEPIEIPQPMVSLLKELLQNDNSKKDFVGCISTEMKYKESKVITPFEEMLECSNAKKHN